ncbi:protein obstructor-E-like [Anneissia japonica]|uniref:protein obstructor-E-like n=1 Tax=Anneissia japonica TaxID=1529436 RepID=UPI001425930A|nr:protein obstructor-E-like [Anneissia japonica]
MAFTQFRSVVIKALIIALFTCQTQSNGSFSCWDYQTGYYVDPLDCTHYYQCQAEMSHVSCGTLYFNEQINTCDWPVNVQCTSTPGATFTCNDKPEGLHYYTDPADCTKYYTCYLVEVRLACGAGQAFNDVLNYCDWIANVPDCPNQATNEANENVQTTQIIQTEDPEVNSEAFSCWDHPTGYYVDPLDCTHYYQCQTEMSHVSCGTLYFNEQVNTCDWRSIHLQRQT